jgi:hypothetical protein
MGGQMKKRRDGWMKKRRDGWMGAMSYRVVFYHPCRTPLFKF